MLTIKIILLYIALFPFSASIPLSAEIQICDIKRGELGLEGKQYPRWIKSKSKRKLSIYKCRRIGTEHDSNNLPIPNKPIFSCCRNALESEKLIIQE